MSKTEELKTSADAVITARALFKDHVQECKQPAPRMNCLVCVRRYLELKSAKRKYLRAIYSVRF